MKVLLVHPYRLGTAGLTTFVLRLQEGLRNTGVPALVMVAGDSDGVAALDEAAGLYAIYLRRPWPESRRLKALLAFVVYLPVTLLSLWRFLRRERVDVVHLHFTFPASLYFAVLRPFSRWKLVATFHGTDGYSLPARTWRYRLLVRLVLQAADLVTAVSADLLRAVRAAYPRLAAPTRVILNGNPVLGELTEATAPPAPGFPASYILAVGSLLARKAYDVLIEAARLVRERGVPLDVVLVGDGPEAPRLASLAAAAGLADHVFFAGEMAQDEALRFYPRARFFVHTARQEAFGLVLLEAMAFGKAVIATRVGGIPEFVRDGETGLLVEPDDPEALAQAMMRLCNDPAFRERLGARGREVATKEHSWERVVDAYCEAYRTVIG